MIRWSKLFSRLVKCKQCIRFDNSTNFFAVPGPRRPVVFQVKNTFSRCSTFLSTMMDSSTSSIKIPDAVRGMTKLDRNMFRLKIDVPVLQVEMKTMTRVMKIIKPFVLKLPKVSPVVELDKTDPCFDSCKMILLLPGTKLTDFSEDKRLDLGKFNVDLTLKQKHLLLEYDNWKADEILRAVLPEDVESVAGFSNIGHIVHLNLRAEHEPYKFLIGEVLLDKNSTAKAVVNKIKSIDNVYRNFQMELLAGENDMEVTVKEHGATFKFDFSKVYWNSRLSTEHYRIVKIIKHGDIVFDVFAGVGPFAVPAAKKGAIVHANDLNPESYKWLKVNMSSNKVKSDFFTYNVDGRVFIRNVVKVSMLNIWTENADAKIHIIMNLPALAIEFLDAFADLFADCNGVDASKIRYPSVYCYCFSNAEDKTTDVANRVNGVLGLSVKRDQVRFVRNVAPNKDMMCVQFDLVPSVLFGDVRDIDGQPPLKKKCLDSDL